MITKIVLGNGTVLNNVEDIQEVLENTGDFIEQSLCINLSKNNQGTIQSIDEVYSLFKTEGVLNKLSVYKKDITGYTQPIEGENLTPIYGEEYLGVEYIKYTNIKTIYKHESTDRISVNLFVTATDIADARYEELKVENADQTIALASLLGM